MSVLATMYMFDSIWLLAADGVYGYLASVVHAVIQAIGRTELEDGKRTGVHLKRLHAHCGVCAGHVKPPLGDDMALGVGQGP